MSRDFYAARRRKAMPKPGSWRPRDPVTVPTWRYGDGVELRSPCCGAPTRLNAERMTLGERDKGLLVECGKSRASCRGSSRTGGCRAFYRVRLGDGEAQWTWQRTFGGI